jgi:hypothetical protein
MKRSREWWLEFATISKKERGRVIAGPYSHYCNDWDGLTVDCTTPEFSGCTCYSGFWFRTMQRICGKIIDWRMYQEEKRVRKAEGVEE